MIWIWQNMSVGERAGIVAGAVALTVFSFSFGLSLGGLRQPAISQQPPSAAPTAYTYEVVNVNERCADTKPLNLGLSTTWDAYEWHCEPRTARWDFDLAKGYFLIRFNPAGYYEVVDSSHLCAQLSGTEPACDFLVGTAGKMKLIMQVTVAPAP